jgi:hypothetical protein
MEAEPESTSEPTSERSTQTHPAVGSTPARPAATLLVIDDDPMVHDLIKRALSGQQLRIESASNGKEGLQLAKELGPDVITLDVMMPEMDGWAVLTALKADPELFNIPVIMLTIVDNKEKGFTLGVSDYLLKPINRATLVTLVEKYKPRTKGSENGLGRILIVEDDSVTRDLLQRTLKDEGWVVIEAENGRVGLEQLAAEKPDLILLDLMMPEMDGFQFITELHSTADWQSIPIVVITALDLTTSDRMRLNGYVQQILQKGAYNRDELLNEVRAQVNAYIL